MASRRHLPLSAALYLMVFLATLTYLMGYPGEVSVWLLLGSIPLVLLVAVITSICRPSFRAQIPMIYHMWKANRALARGDYAEAERRSRKAVAYADATHINYDLGMGMTLALLAEVYRQKGRLADAEPIYRKAIRHYDEATPYKPLLRATAVLNLGAVHINQGRYAEAEPLCREALTVYVNSNNDNRIVALLNLGQALLGQKQYAEAEEVTRRALERLTPQMESGSLAGAIALSNLADISRAQGRCTEAEPLARRARAAFEKVAATAPRALEIRFLTVLAETLQPQGKVEETEALCQRSQELAESVYGPEHFTLARPLGTLARLRAAQGRDEEAAALYQRCLAIFEIAAPVHPEGAERKTEYAALLRKMGREIESAPFKTVQPETEGIRTNLPPGSYRG